MKPGVPASLTKEQIAKAALELGDRIGIENVSIRKLAACLGKTPMALYTYFDSIQQIREAALALAFKEVDADPVPGERWDNTMRRTMSSIRAMYLRHAGCNLIKIDGSGYAPGMIEHTERIYRLHEAQGIPPEILRCAWQVIDAFLTGFMNMELNEIQKNPQHPDAKDKVWIETAEHAYSEKAFNEGIDIILGGLRALAAPDPCEWYTPVSN